MPTPSYPLDTDKVPGEDGIVADLNQAYANINDLDQRTASAAEIESVAAQAVAAAALATDVSNIATPDALVKTLVANPASETAVAVLASIDGRAGGGLLNDFGTQADQSMSGAPIQSGGSWILSGAAGPAAVIDDGAFTIPSTGAAYARTVLGGEPIEVGGVVSFGPGSTGGSNCTLIVSPGDDLENLAIHVPFGRAGFIAQVRSASGPFDVRAAHNYDTTAADYTRQTIKVGIHGSTVVIVGHDGVPVSFTDDRIPALIGDNPRFWVECLRTNSSDSQPFWHQAYALTDSAPAARGGAAGAATAIAYSAARPPAAVFLDASDLAVDGYGFRVIDLATTTEVYFVTVDVDCSINFDNERGEGQRFQLCLRHTVEKSGGAPYAANASPFVRGGSFTTPALGQAVYHDLTMGAYSIAGITNSSAPVQV